MDLSDDPHSDLLFVGFNQDSGCFACGTDSGFRIYNTDPFKEMFRRSTNISPFRRVTAFVHGGIGRVEMLFRCNILALVGGGPSPRYPPDKVMIWDDHQNRNIGELSFRSAVRNVKLRRDRVVVVLRRKIYVYNFADLTMLHHIETVDNPRGLCSLSPGNSAAVLACPATQRGRVRVELFDSSKTLYIDAHETHLACLALNLTGSRLATASTRGTLIRVHDTHTGALLQELRRGADPTTIHSIAFNADASMLACTSEKGTCHIFRLKDEVHDPTGPASVAGGVTGGDAAAVNTLAEHEETVQAGPASRGTEGSAEGGTASAETDAARGGGAVDERARAGSDAFDDEAVEPGNQQSTFSFLRGILPKYFSSEWSFAQYRIPRGKSICAFGAEPHSIIVITADGAYYKATFERGGDAVRSVYSPFMTKKDEHDGAS